MKRARQKKPVSAAQNFSLAFSRPINHSQPKHNRKRIAVLVNLQVDREGVNREKTNREKAHINNEMFFHRLRPL